MTQLINVYCTRSSDKVRLNVFIVDEVVDLKRGLQRRDFVWHPSTYDLVCLKQPFPLHPLTPGGTKFYLISEQTEHCKLNDRVTMRLK